MQYRQTRSLSGGRMRKTLPAKPSEMASSASWADPRSEGSSPASPYSMNKAVLCCRESVCFLEAALKMSARTGHLPEPPARCPSPDSQVLACSYQGDGSGSAKTFPLPAQWHQAWHQFANYFTATAANFSRS